MVEHQYPSFHFPKNPPQYSPRPTVLNPATQTQKREGTTCQHSIHPTNPQPTPRAQSIAPSPFILHLPSARQTVPNATNLCQTVPPTPSRQNEATRHFCTRSSALSVPLPPRLAHARAPSPRHRNQQNPTWRNISRPFWQNEAIRSVDDPARRSPSVCAHDKSCR
jgi:hypothetical protein